MSEGPLELSGRGLSIEDVVAVARDHVPAALAPDAAARVAASAEALEEHLRAGHAIYGLTTGVGALDGSPVAADARAAQQLDLLRSHAAGAGQPLPGPVVRAMTLARANALAGGQSGVQPATLQALLDLLRAPLVPRVPRLGSVGASDLAPLAHLALVLVGEGRAWWEGELLPGGEALRRAGLRPIELGGRDGLALLNGNALTLGRACLLLFDVRRLVEAAEATAALSVCALGEPLPEQRALAAQPHPGSLASAARIEDLLAGRAAPPTAGPGVSAERSSLSTRTVAHVAGATRDALAHARGVTELELNAAVDNPMIAPDGWYTNNAANFSGQHLAQALDLVAASVAALAAQSERRLARLLDPAQNRGLPAFLALPAEGPASSGLMVAQYTAAAVVADLRQTSGPTCAQSLPTCASAEDFVSLCSMAAERAARSASRAWLVLGIELLAAGRGAELRALPLPPALQPVQERLRARLAALPAPHPLGDAIEAAVELVREGLPAAR